MEARAGVSAQVFETEALFFWANFVIARFSVSGVSLSDANVQDMHTAIHRICGKHPQVRPIPWPQTLTGRGFPRRDTFAPVARPMTPQRTAIRISDSNACS
jgi:hypothetical protein